MKKFMSIMMAAVVAICGLALTSCDGVGEVCDKDVWIEKDYPPIQGQNITAYFYYTDNDGYKSDTELVDFIPNGDEEPKNVKNEIKAGLNIFLIVNSDNDLVDGVVGKKVLFKNFPKGTIVDKIIDSVDGEEESQKSFLDSLVINDTTWLAIELYQKMWNKGGTAVPYCLKKSSKYQVSTDIKDLFENLSWKKILATILVSSLEDEQ